MPAGSGSKVRATVPAQAGERTAQTIGDLKDRLLTVALAVIGAMAALFTAIEFFLD